MKKRGYISWLFGIIVAVTAIAVGISTHHGGNSATSPQNEQVITGDSAIMAQSTVSLEADQVNVAQALNSMAGGSVTATEMEVPVGKELAGISSAFTAKKSITLNNANMTITRTASTASPLDTGQHHARISGTALHDVALTGHLKGGICSGAELAST